MHFLILKIGGFDRDTLLYIIFSVLTDKHSITITTEIGYETENKVLFHHLIVLTIYILITQHYRYQQRRTLCILCK